jgi:hypothetical protein
MSTIAELESAYQAATLAADQLVKLTPPDDKAISEADKRAGEIYEQLMELEPTGPGELRRQVEVFLHHWRGVQPDEEIPDDEEPFTARRLLDRLLRLT